MCVALPSSPSITLCPETVRARHPNASISRPGFSSSPHPFRETVRLPVYKLNTWNHPASMLPMLVKALSRCVCVWPPPFPHPHTAKKLYDVNKRPVTSLPCTQVSLEGCGRRDNIPATVRIRTKAVDLGFVSSQLCSFWHEVTEIGRSPFRLSSQRNRRNCHSR